MKFVSDYAKNKALRDSLNTLSNNIFGVTVLKPTDIHYVPFSFLDEGRIVANVSVGTFHQYINGIEQNAYMIQTVCTLPDYRRRGLIKRLFKKVDEYINARNGISFLLANRKLEEFYRQFNFSSIEFADHFEGAAPGVILSSSRTVKVDFQSPDEKLQLAECVRLRSPVSNVYGDIKQNWLFLWYCDRFFGNDIYYITDLDVYVIYKIEGDCLTLFDIIGKTVPDIEVLFPFIGTEDIQKIRYFFTPDKLSPEFRAVTNEEDYLFIRGNFQLPASIFTIPMLARG